MSILDMFDKIDDIVYKPIETICEWTKEPLRKWEHKRESESIACSNNHEKEMLELKAINERKKQSQEAQIEMDKKRFEQKLSEQEAQGEMDRRRFEQELSEQERRSITEDFQERARIEADIRRWNAEIDEFILEQEDERRDRLVDCIKRYQTDLAKVAIDIAKNIGMMSLELREKANNMVFEQTQKYKELQSEAKKQSMLELKEAKDEFFEVDRDTYLMLVSNILDERRSAVEMADKFINELSEDIKRLNKSIDITTQIGMENTNSCLSAMTKQLGITLKPPHEPLKQIE